MTALVRNTDPATSHSAAVKVDRTTIRDRVLAFALAAGPLGFIDHDLQSIDPTAPESSIRKRRSELTRDGLIINTGSTRMNANNVASFVWKHRDFTADQQHVYIGSAATSPLTEKGLREALEFAHKRKAKSHQKLLAAENEVMDANVAVEEATRALDNWLNRDGMVLL